MVHVYVLISEDGQHCYTGMSENIDRRLTQHNAGFNRSTKSLMPWKLVYSKGHQRRAIARQREKYLKSAAGRKWFDKLSLI